MASKTVYDWTVADLGTYLQGCDATLTVRPRDHLLIAPDDRWVRGYDVSIASKHGSVMVQAASFVDALAEAVRKHDVVRS